MLRKSRVLGRVLHNQSLVDQFDEMAEAGSWKRRACSALRAARRDTSLAIASADNFPNLRIATMVAPRSGTSVGELEHKATGPLQSKKLRAAVGELLPVNFRCCTIIDLGESL